jgi:hypothetical protein
LGKQIGKVPDCLASAGKAGTERDSIGKQLAGLVAQAAIISTSLSSKSVVQCFLVGYIGAYLINVALAILCS